ncbi:S-layer homology domain-containing protein [Patescibacteria group bacterium]|nr:S-layer homology domain-containing protein [Patescibacteria group bacterium]
MDKKAISTLFALFAGIILFTYILVATPMPTTDLAASIVVQTFTAEAATSDVDIEVEEEILMPSYSDVAEGYPYFEAIEYITQNGIVEGYADGTYKPNAQINRAEFTKILVEAKLGLNPISYASDCFNDFDSSQWYASYVCYAKSNGIIEGYPDGSFGPANDINVAEAAKILVNVFEIEQIDPIGTDWYSVYIETMGSNAYLPPSFEYINDQVTRGEMAEMIWRVMEEQHGFVSAINLQNSPCTQLGEDIPANVDMGRVRATWLDWYNDVRADLDLAPYIYNDQLNRTAIIWSELAEDRGYIDHKRPGYTAYYDYYGILNWFENLGISFEAQGGYTYVENIAWEMYYCKDTEPDCTDAMINSIRKGFNFFVSEKGTSYTAHYDSIINPAFKEIGLGIAVDPTKNKYYLTVHYATKISSDPIRICD